VFSSTNRKIIWLRKCSSQRTLCVLGWNDHVLRVSSSVMTYLILVYLCRYSKNFQPQFLRAAFQCTTLKVKKLSTCTMSTKRRDKLHNRMQYLDTELLKYTSDIPNLKSEPKTCILHYGFVEWKPHFVTFMACCCVWSRNFVDKEAIACAGLQCQSK
jgi:hypothetical protein